MQYWTLYGQLFQKDGGVTGDESMSKQGFKMGISFDRKGIFLYCKRLLCIAITFEEEQKSKNIFLWQNPFKQNIS